MSEATKRTGAQLYRAIEDKRAEIARCVEGANTILQTAQSAIEECERRIMAHVLALQELQLEAGELLVVRGMSAALAGEPASWVGGVDAFHVYQMEDGPHMEELRQALAPEVPIPWIPLGKVEREEWIGKALREEQGRTFAGTGIPSGYLVYETRELTPDEALTQGLMQIPGRLLDGSAERAAFGEPAFPGTQSEFLSRFRMLVHGTDLKGRELAVVHVRGQPHRVTAAMDTGWMSVPMDGGYLHVRYVRVAPGGLPAAGLELLKRLVREDIGLPEEAALEVSLVTSESIYRLREVGEGVGSLVQLVCRTATLPNRSGLPDGLPDPQ